jgi:hypothetical protein
MLKLLGVVIEMRLVQMPEIEHYWNKSKLFGSEVTSKYDVKRSICIR